MRFRGVYGDDEAVLMVETHNATPYFAKRVRVVAGPYTPDELWGHVGVIDNPPGDKFFFIILGNGRILYMDYAELMELEAVVGRPDLAKLATDKVSLETLLEFFTITQSSG